MNKKTKFIRAGKPPGGYRGSHRVAICVFALVFLFLPFTIFAANSGNTTGWGWAEKFGWLSFSGEGASVDYGVSVSVDQITGYAWSEKTGWISFNCLNRLSCDSVSYGVTNDGNGNLSGYAWSEKGGWINFEGAGAINYQVVVSQDGKFHGFAWSEKLGWINTNDVGSYYEPETDYAPARIYYSVGQNTTDHKTGSPTVTVSGLSATFSVPQTATNMGVGDVIDYDTDNKLCYIFAKVSEETWLCQTATGNAPTATTGATVNAVRHSFASLSLAEAGATGISYLNTTDLVAGNYQLNFPCYYDTGADTTAVTIDGYTTGSANYIKVYTPNNTATEVNQSQRHGGKWDDTKYRVVVSTAWAATMNISSGYVIVDGIQLNETASGADGGGRNIEYTGTGELQVSSSILKYSGSGDVNSAYGNIVLSSAGTGSTAKIWNNIIYDNNSAGIKATDRWSNALTVILYNNAIINCETGIDADGSALTLIAKNNITQSCTDGYDDTGYWESSDYNISDIAGDTTGISTSYRNGQATTVNFADPGNDDFHLSPNDTLAIGAGTDLSADSYLPFSTDIDGDARSRWDIGADEKAGENIIKGGTRLKGGVRLK